MLRLDQFVDPLREARFSQGLIGVGVAQVGEYVAAADFNFTINKSGSSITVNASSQAYDLDHESEPKKGIVTKEWYYKEINSPTWIKLTGVDSDINTNTTSFSGETTKDYFLKHNYPKNNQKQNEIIDYFHYIFS